MIKELKIYPAASCDLLTGAAEKSLDIFFDLSSTIAPYAPMVVVTVVTANTPAIIQLSIVKRAPSVTKLSRFLTINVSQKQNIKRYYYKTPRREKNTEVLSLKYSFRLRLIRFVITVIYAPSSLISFPVILTKASSILPLMTSNPVIRFSTLFTSGSASIVLPTDIKYVPPDIE